MTWRIENNSPGAAAYVVSDVEYSGIDFGNGVEDTIDFTATDGLEVHLNLSEIDVITCFNSDVSPAPGVYPGYLIHVHGLGGSTDYHVDSVTKTAVQAALHGPGTEDTRIAFMTLEGVTVHLYTKNIRLITFKEDALLIPEPD
jgi:hypothetical protein